MVCNVEYNQLEDVIRSTIDERGDFADESGYSPYDGIDGTVLTVVSLEIVIIFVWIFEHISRLSIIVMELFQNLSIPNTR